jgi:hypothetical protein
MSERRGRGQEPAPIPEEGKSETETTGTVPPAGVESEAQSAAGGQGGMVLPGAVVSAQDPMHPAVQGDRPDAGLTPFGRPAEAIQRESDVCLQELREAKAMVKDASGEVREVKAPNIVTKSDAIRWLTSIGHSRSAVAKALGISYQHVRNVSMRPIKKGPSQTPWQVRVAGGQTTTAAMPAGTSELRKASAEGENK